MKSRAAVAIEKNYGKKLNIEPQLIAASHLKRDGR